MYTLNQNVSKRQMNIHERYRQLKDFCLGNENKERCEGDTIISTERRPSSLPEVQGLFGDGENEIPPLPKLPLDIRLYV